MKRVHILVALVSLFLLLFSVACARRRATPPAAVPAGAGPTATPVIPPPVTPPKAPTPSPPGTPPVPPEEETPPPPPTAPPLQPPTSTPTPPATPTAPPPTAPPTQPPTPTPPPPQPPAAPAPEEYQGVYADLSAILDDISARLDREWDGQRYNVTFGAELLPANANRGESLLTPQSYQGILLYLDRLQELGVQGVKVSIGYPVLTSGFPRSSEYVELYRKLAQEIRKRDMKLLVGAGVVFTDPTVSKVSVDFSGLTLDQYRAGKREHVERIIREIQPDYVTIGNEPDVEASITGLSLDVQGYTALMQFILEGLDRGNTLVGAGTGSWNNPDYIQSFASNTDLDYIDIHIYPVNKGYFDRALELAEIAGAHGKKVVVGEAWLYKTADKEVGKIGQNQVFARDVFSFWEPLDIQFLQVLARFAHYKQVDFISPFWTRYFFAYLEYTDSTRDLPPAQLLFQANVKAVSNLLTGQFTQTGLAYRSLATGEGKE